MAAPFNKNEATLNQKKKYEVAQIFRRYGPLYRKTRALPTRTIGIMQSIEQCRTAWMGYHRISCLTCPYHRREYNSCRNRHCPKCQSINKAEWLEKRKSELLPVGYLHKVFTLPHELNQLILRNKELLLEYLFKAVSETLKQFTKDPKWRMGGSLGYTAVLHTWDQKMNSHIHLHLVVAAGSFLKKEKKWVPAAKKRKRKTGLREDYMFSAHALSEVFQGKYLDLLKKAYDQGKLELKGKVWGLNDPAEFKRLLNTLYSKNWVVYAKKPFKGVEHVYDYLGRYTHRVAISNNRITSVKDGKVSFNWKDRSNGYETKSETLDAQTFIQRFMLHELPPRFMRIRQYGFLSNRYKKENLTTIRELLNVPQLELVKEKSGDKILSEQAGVDHRRCPDCKKGKLITTLELNRSDVRAIFKKHQTVTRNTEQKIQLSSA